MVSPGNTQQRHPFFLFATDDDAGLTKHPEALAFLHALFNVDSLGTVTAIKSSLLCLPPFVASTTAPPPGGAT